MEKQNITVFKIRIDSIKKHAIGFELFSGERVQDTYVNVLAKGGYGVKGRFLLTPKQFADFANRLIAYVYLSPKAFNDEELFVLWGLRLNIFDCETQQMSGTIFTHERLRRIKEILKTLKNKKT